MAFQAHASWPRSIGIERRCRPVPFISVQTRAKASEKENEAAVPSRKADKKPPKSSWTGKRVGQKAGDETDFLSNLGSGQDYNINVDHGQNLQHLDSLFAGKMLGHQSDIADGSLRAWEFRKFGNLVGDYCVSPRFLDAVTMHVVKNYMNDAGCFDASLRVPLILGIWGGKGQGKTFQTELAFKKLGLEPIVMSAGELEHEWAGTPGRLIRQRYRRAAELSKMHGKLSCLLINDIDAGIGHFQNTQITVNNQMVVGTLMNICDSPNKVSIGQEWREGDWVRRIPIIVTGNDFSKVFAPLVREGRMSKFYWRPERDELIAILHQMYRDDGLSLGDMGTILDTFPDQPLDFYGAMRASLFDNQIRRWIEHDVMDATLTDEDANLSELSKRLVDKDNLPKFEAVDLTVEKLLQEGRRLAAEQDQVMNHKLSVDYMKNTGSSASLIGLSG